MPGKLFNPIFIALILHCALAIPGILNAQATDADIVNFIAFQDDRFVYLQWEIKAGRTCDGIRIMRSDQQEGNDHEIGYIDGICGQVDVAETYNFTDMNPDPHALTWYKLIPGGFREYSITYRFSAVPLHTAYSWFAHAEGYTGIRYLQDTPEPLTLKVYDATGKLVWQSDARDGIWTITRDDVNPGIYTYHILSQNGETRATGRCITYGP